MEHPTTEEVLVLFGAEDVNVFRSKERMLTYFKCWCPDKDVRIEGTVVLIDGMKRFELVEGVLWR